MSSAADVAIIGGGIVGCAAAAFLAEAGAKVELYERDEVGAAASGRNSGSIQHPFDPVLAELHLETLAHYRALEGLELGEAPAGVLMLAPERAQLEPAVEEIARDCPELDATCSTRRSCAASSRASRPGCGHAGSRPATRSGRSLPRAHSRGAPSRRAFASARASRRGRG